MAARTLSLLLPASYAFSPSGSRRTGRPGCLPLQSSVKSGGLASSLLCDVAFLRSRNQTARIHRPVTKASIFFMLPTAKPDRAPADKLPKWSARAIKAFGMAELEARKLKYSTTGTEALLMGILVEGTSVGSKFLRANGITLFKVREEIVKLLGKSDMYYFSPEHPPLTEPAQRALDWAVDEKMKSVHKVSSSRNIRNTSGKWG
ncbi:ATP-dependent Clp protease ATP-binding subunit CLPT1, chloroplastic-like isoform X2 [Magnolia sinica]|uniref:ATP-dependent Clp protease ATP-binding subunit CLPT1, chloroplastic-like isoform X2 n=1 Tax=Magnolia sinica TaxID=86752 RepID=UPI002659EE35|nr:ATP-dependent Clp protease ATP-binding subunit CLPT1, chloroplastic-like isoform X2 [Magnolia sinica]